MKRVAQEDDEGCQTACVAMIAGVSYRSVKVKVETDTDGSMTLEQLRKALRTYGFNLKRRISLAEKYYSDLKQDGLLRAKITPTRGNDSWSHWMVWDSSKGAILDPTKMHISSRKTRLIAFYPIERA